MDIAQKLLAEHPRFAPAIKLKAMLLEQAGRDTEAGVLFEEALRLAPNDPDPLLNAGVFRLRAHQNEEAIRLLEHCVRIPQYALKLQPTVRDAHTNHGIVALKEGDHDCVELEFKAELASDPNSQDAIAELG